MEEEIEGRGGEGEPIRVTAIGLTAKNPNYADSHDPKLELTKFAAGSLDGVEYFIGEEVGIFGAGGGDAGSSMLELDICIYSR